MPPVKPAAVALLVLGAATALAAGGDAPGWEGALLGPVNDLPDGLRPALEPVMVLGTFVAPFAVAAVAGALTRAVRPAADVVMAGLVAYWAALAVKALVSRERPGVLLDDVHVRDPDADGFGFVSGHASVAVAIATALVPFLPRWGQVAAVAVAALVSSARLYEGVHLPLDVVGGAAVGVLSALATRALLDRLEHEGVADDGATPGPRDTPVP